MFYRLSGLCETQEKFRGMQNIRYARQRDLEIKTEPAQTFSANI